MRVVVIVVKGTVEDVLLVELDTTLVVGADDVPLGRSRKVTGESRSLCLSSGVVGDLV